MIICFFSQWLEDTNIDWRYIQTHAWKIELVLVIDYFNHGAHVCDLVYCFIDCRYLYRWVILFRPTSVCGLLDYNGYDYEWQK